MLFTRINYTHSNELDCMSGILENRKESCYNQNYADEVNRNPSLYCLPNGVGRTAQQ